MWSLSSHTGLHAAQIPEDWVAYHKGGLVVPYPPGWTIQPGAAGSFVAKRMDTSKTLGALIYVRPLDGKKTADSKTRLEALHRLAPDLFTGIKLVAIESLSQVPDVAVARYVYAKRGIAYKAVALCFQHNGRGVVYVMMAQEKSWARDAPDMLTMLRTFFYSPSGRRVQPVLPATVTWRDPVEGAFSIAVPTGWSVQGGTRRTSALQVDREVVMVNPSHTIALRVGDASIPHMQLPETMGLILYAEGTWHPMSDGASRLYVLRYLPGPQFLKDFYLPNKFPQAKTLQLQDHPDLATAVYNRQAASYAPLPVRFDLGEITFSATIDGQPRRGRFYALTSLVDTSMISGHLSGMWNVDMLAGYLCAPEQEGLANALLDHVAATLRIDPLWQQRQAQLSRQAIGVYQATQSEINAMIFEHQQQRSAMTDRAHEAQVQSIRGTIEMRDPQTHQLFEVQAGSNYYWRGGPGDTIIGTETASPSELPSHWLGQLLERTR